MTLVIYYFFLFYYLLDDYYTAVTNFMQGYVDNEINLNNEQTCSKTCEDYNVTRNVNCNEDTLCAQNHFKEETCKGRVLNCTTIDVDITACLVVG